MKLKPEIDLYSDMIGLYSTNLGGISVTDQKTTSEIIRILKLSTH